MTSRRLLLVPALALALVSALGLGIVPSGATAAPAPSVDSAFTPRLTYVGCPADVKPVSTKCAELTVPLDWQTPDDGRTTTIALRLIPSTRGGHEGFTFNPGGPGASGIEIGEPIYAGLPRQVRDRFDFVSWDPRGVGLSGPALVGCPLPADTDLPLTGPVDWHAYWAATLASFAASNTACLAANPNSAPYLGTWQVVRDLEALRIALGYEQWNYWGMSYGTRIGNTYARTFPTSLRALIMDGSVMAGETAYRFGTTFPAGLEVTKQVYASVTGRNQAHKIDVIQDYLNDNLDLAVGGEVLDRWTFASTLRGLMVAQANYPAIRAYVNSLYDAVVADTSAQRVRSLLALSRSAGRLPRADEDDYIQVLVNCLDLHDRPTAEQLAAASVAAERQYGITTPAFMGNSAPCSGLPAELSPAVTTGTDTVMLPHPPMFVLSTGDAATPWIWGRGMANTFAGSRVISYAGTQHVTYMATRSTCVNKPITQYLLTLQRPSGDISCRFVAGVPARS